MIIRSLTLHNFGVYLRRQEFDLSPESSDRPVVLVGGLNGCGKTTILEALHVCLYGKLANTPRRQGRAYADYLTSLINRNVSAKDGASVEVCFTDLERKQEVQVYRQWAKPNAGLSENLQVSIDGQYDKALSESWSEAVDTYLPQRLCDLFFFDGEQIEQLASPSRGQEILSTAIANLLGLDLIDRAGSDLNILHRRLYQQAAPTDEQEKLRTLNVEREELVEKKGSLEQQRQEAFQAVAACRGDLDSIERKLRQEGAELLESATAIEEHTYELRAQQREQEATLRSLAASELPLALVQDQLKELKSDLETRLANENAQASAKAISDLIPELDEVLQSATEEAQVRRTVVGWLEGRREKLEQRTSKTKTQFISTSVIGEIEALTGRRVHEAVKDVEKLQAQIDEIEDQIVLEERKLEQVPDREQVQSLYDERIEVKGELESRERQYKELEEQVRKVAQQLEELDGRIEKTQKAIKASSENQEMQVRMADTATQAQEVLQSFKRAAAARHVERLQDLIVECYTQLLRKRGLVNRVAIDPSSFEMDLFDSSGSKVDPERLSAGERQLLATSILWALARASGRALPVAIDTPLGRLDSSHRENLVRNYFPEASHQVILLSTDEEIGPDYYELLTPYIGREYRLEFDSDSESVRVVNGYFEREAA